MEIGKIKFAKYDAFDAAVAQIREERGLPSPTRPTSPMPTCKPPKKSAEEMLKKALEYANQGMDAHEDYLLKDSLYSEGLYYAYEDMAAHLEMLIKEAKQ